MPLTPLGAREVGISAAVFCVGTIVFISLFRQSGSYWHLAPILPLAVLFFWVIWFFRDPRRSVPDSPGLIVSPADGVVSHLDTAREDEYIGGDALRCSIFMSVFNVHINRAPAAGKIEFVKFRPGEFFDARREESLVKNQNQDIGIAPSEPGMPSKMVVRQSTGAIARTIVCPVREGMELRRGEKYGMIKFGSRVTLLMSPDARVTWLVKPGDRVRGGETALAAILPGAENANEESDR